MAGPRIGKYNIDISTIEDLDGIGGEARCSAYAEPNRWRPLDDNLASDCGSSARPVLPLWSASHGDPGVWADLIRLLI